MPAIVCAPPSETKICKVKLHKKGLVVDSRVIGWDRAGWKMECTIEGDIMTVKRLYQGGWAPYVDGWEKNFYFRIYDPSIEKVPPFDNKFYRYYGMDNERPPFEVEEVVVDPSVSVIKQDAFFGCQKMTKITMGDNIEEIEENAFACCSELKNLRLPRGLKTIGKNVFSRCKSIECLFIPPNVDKIGRQAFRWCRQMKILVLPSNIHIDNIGEKLVAGCSSLLGATDCPSVKYDEDIWKQLDAEEVQDSFRINQWVLHRYDHLPLIRLCTDPDVTAEMIQSFAQTHGTAPFYYTDDDYELTPLHILTRYNDFAAPGASIACYSANPKALFILDKDSRTKFDYDNERIDATPLDLLWKKDRVDIIVHIMQDLCINKLEKNSVDLNLNPNPLRVRSKGSESSKSSLRSRKSKYFDRLRNIGRLAADVCASYRLEHKTKS